jgi:hypothetical protein
MGCLVAMVLGIPPVHADYLTPVRATGLKSEYCIDVDAISLKIQNTTDGELHFSTSVERLGESGRWEEFAADVLGKEPLPWKVKLGRLSKDQTRSIRWQPRRTGSRLGKGKYRVVANVIAGKPPATAHVVGEFVANDGCGRRTP